MVLRGGTRRGGVGQESLVGAGCRHTGCRLGSLCGLRGLSCGGLGCYGALGNLRQGGLSRRLSRLGSLRRLCGLEGSRGGRLLSNLGCLSSVGLLDGLNRGRCGSLLCLFCLLADLYSNLREGRLHGGGEQGVGSGGCGSCAGDVLNDGCKSGSGCYQGATEHGGYCDGCQGASFNGAGAKCHWNRPLGRWLGHGGARRELSDRGL